MGTNERYNIRWNDFDENIKAALKDMREESEFFDVTLVAGDGKQVKANKVVLAGGSSFFFKILKENPHPHPLIYLKFVSYDQLKSMLDFIYTGQASIVQEDLNQFLVIAEDLKIKGLFQTEPQTKSDRSIPAPLQSQGAAEEASPPRHEKEDVKECSPSTRIRHHHSGISSPRGNLPQATSEQNNENTSNVKVDMLDAEHNNDSYKINENDNPNKRRSSMLDKNEGENESKKNVKILGSNYIKEIGQKIYGLSADNQGMDSNCNMNAKEAANNVLNEQSTDTYYQHSEEKDNSHKPFKCLVCLKRFTRKDTLKEHEVRRHTGEMPYPCLQCSKKFLRPNHLKMHENVHTGEKPFRCSYCSKTFHHVLHLKYHEKINCEVLF